MEGLILSSVRMRRSLGIFLMAAVMFAAPQSDDNSAGSASQQAKPAPPPAPTVTRSSQGITVIKGSTRQPADETKEAAGEAKAAETQAAGESGKSAAKTSGAGEQKVLQTRTIQRRSFDPSGNPIPVATQQTVHETRSGSQSALVLRNISGHEVPYLTEQEKVISEGPGTSVVERRTHRYSTDGRPTSQQLVREEKKTLPDGAVQTTTTVYESDVNGHMQPVERWIAEEKKVGETTRTIVTAERPSINGGFRTYEREEQVENRQGEAFTTIETVRKVADATGQLVEAEREQSVMKKSGDVATTETKVWKQSASTTGRMELHSRKVGQLVQRPDGSMTEVVETYGRSRVDGPVDVNSTGARLQERVVRETQVTAGGETIQTTTTQSRGVADPSQLGQKRVMRQVVRPSASGETIETQVYESGVNGRVRQTESYVEQVEKQAP